MRRRPVRQEKESVERGKFNIKRDDQFKELNDADRDWSTDIKLCGCCGFMLLALYTFTLHPSIAGGDSGELIVSAHELGVAHPPGYPLFTLLSKLFMTFLPFNSLAWRVNFMNAIFSSLSSVFLQLSLLRLTHCAGSSLLVLAFYSLNKLTWKWSTSAEVFSLNNFFCSLLVFLIVCMESPSSGSRFIKKASILAFISGLALTNQHTIIFPVISVALWTLVKLKKNKLLSWRVICYLSLSACMGLSIYLYLPLSSYFNVARWTWGDQRSIEGFLKHLLRKEYGTFDLGKGQTGSGFYNAISLYGSHLQHRMCELCPWLSLIGLVASISWSFMGKNTSCFVVCLMTITYISFFCWRANLDLSNPLFVGVVERFWLQSDIGFVLLATLGYHTAIRLVTEKFLGSSKLAMTSVFTTLGSVVLIILQLKNISSCNQNSNVVIHNFAKTILESLPKDSLVLTKGDLPANSLRYFHLCENVRTDLQLLDVEILSYEWSVPMLKKIFPRIDFPGDVWQLTNGLYADGRESFNFKKFLDANINKRPIFACIGMQDKDHSWEGHYKVWPYGVCSAVKPIRAQFEPVEWANRTGGIADKWIFPVGGFEITSWEKIANDEMWHSKIDTAFFMYKKALETKDMEAKSILMAESYRLYFRAIKMHQLPSRMNHIETFPSFWHKNFALVCEKLLHVDLSYNIYDLDKMKLCKLSIYHFEQYLHLNPKDADGPKIAEAIGILKGRLDVFENLDKADETLERSIKRVEKIEKMAEAAKETNEVLKKVSKNL